MGGRHTLARGGEEAGGPNSDEGAETLVPSLYYGPSILREQEEELAQQCADSQGGGRRVRRQVNEIFKLYVVHLQG